MIISHKYKYIFIQIQKTASSAISRELCIYYAGEPILWKHAGYSDFIKVATDEEKKYFIFAGVRNPLDIIVSNYHILKEGRVIKYNLKNFQKHKFIKNNNSDFVDFFNQFQAGSIYEDLVSQKNKNIDYIYRYEDVKNEFSQILNRLGIVQVRPLDLFNVTTGKMDYREYYKRSIQGRAKIVFGKYMKKWGYIFEDDWQDPKMWEKYIFLPYMNCWYFKRKLFYKFYLFFFYQSYSKKMMSIPSYSYLKDLLYFSTSEDSSKKGRVN